MPLNPDSPLARLMNAPVKPGRVIWIGLRVSRRAPLQVVESALALAGAGLDGDHYSRKEGSRQVTLIQAESLRAIASHLGLDEVSPGGLRRNIVTSGINLNALKDRRFRIGDAVLEASGECHPARAWKRPSAWAAITRCAVLAASRRASSKAARSRSRTRSCRAE